jgi:hypothetical protein
MKQRLMELYFAEGADLSDPKTLIRAAVDCGMDGDLVRRLLASDADADRVENEANSAKEAGIDGVPCFIFGGSLIVTGAQSPEYLANAIPAHCRTTDAATGVKRGNAARARCGRCRVPVHAATRAPAQGYASYGNRSSLRSRVISRALAAARCW